MKTDIASKTEIDSEGLTDSGFNQNANFHGKYQGANTIEGFWSLLRFWLRPHRGVSQENLPLYLGFFEFAYNSKKRGKALFGALLGVLLT